MIVLFEVEKKYKKSKPLDYKKNKLLLKSAVCNSKKPRFIKKQEASQIQGTLGLKTPLK